MAYPLIKFCSCPAVMLLIIVLIALSPLSAQPKRVTAPSGTFGKIETSFELPDFAGDPFDDQTADVRAQIRRPHGTSSNVLAFFDGGTTWRIRFTPQATGRYALTGITLNGARVEPRYVAAKEWTVTGQAQPGFVRLGPAGSKYFVYDNGTRYYPLGHNQAWRSNGLPDIPELFGKMKTSGENWSRVWMNHWDGKNLDWPAAGKLGTLNLEVARRWDSIVSAAEANGIYFQLVFQHHGQYSSTVNPNWNDNPYNIARGGFLTKPEEFFTNEQAKQLTRRKLRYSVARWGYSPHIMAWELWNEVQFTDAARNNQWPAIATWHREMAAYLRQIDPYNHLITTSSLGSLTPEVWASVDFYQEHTYPSDLVVALSQSGPHGNLSEKPFFVGEFGPGDLGDPQGAGLHAGLWASLMSNAGGAAQYWTWDEVERQNLYDHFRGAARFLKASGLVRQHDLQKVSPTIATAAQADLVFGPGSGWGEAKHSDFMVTSSGPPENIGTLPNFLQGNNHRAMNPRPLTFRVNYPQAGRFIVNLTQAAKAGAHLKLSVDGKVTERDFPAVDRDISLSGEAASIAVDVPSGAHTITLENTGTDWVQVRNFTLTNYAPALGAQALRGPQFFAAWVFQRANLNARPENQRPATTGTLSVPGLKAGRYQAVWLDTLTGQPQQSIVITQKGTAPMTLKMPSIARDMALYVVPASR